MQNSNIKDFGDLYFEIKFKDGSEWKESFKRHLEIDKNLEFKKNNKFVNSFMQGSDLMTMTSIKRNFKTWMQDANSWEEIAEIKWYVA